MRLKLAERNKDGPSLPLLPRESSLPVKKNQMKKKKKKKIRRQNTYQFQAVEMNHDKTEREPCS